MKWQACLWGMMILAGVGVRPSHAGDVADYLTRDGELKQTITVRIGDVQFLAPPEEVWTIKPNGDWEWESTESNGKLSPRQMKALAQHLATQDFKSLPKTQGYEPPPATSGYHYVEIAFGETKPRFCTKSGETVTDYLPKLDDPNAAAWSRFVAMELVMADILQMADVRAEYGIKPRRRADK